MSNANNIDFSPYAKFFFDVQYIRFFHIVNGEKQRIFKDEIFYDYNCKTLSEAEDMFPHHKMLTSEEIEFVNSLPKN